MPLKTLPHFIAQNVSLAEKTTLGVGGPARYFATPGTTNELREGLGWARSHALPCWILGGGSNVVISDDGLDGMIIQIPNAQKTILEQREDSVILEIDAGHDWDALVAWVVEQNWSGLECLSGIPGRVGAAPIQNIGAYGQELSEVFHHAEILDLETMKEERWDATRCQFGYRQSAFKRAPQGRYLILKVALCLSRGGAPALRYPELQRALDAVESPPSLKKVRELVLALRKKKSMVYDVNDPNSHSAGSFFLNPIVSQQEADAVEKRMARLVKDEQMPRYPASDGQCKLSAAWLIERSGLHKGYGDGKVGLSQKHTLAIVNRADASAREVIDFAKFVRKHVAEACGLALHPEPNLLGFPEDFP